MQFPIVLNLNAAGIAADSFDSAQILCLPENILSTGNLKDLLETTDMDSLTKALRDSGVKVFTFMDAGLDLPAMDRRSGDKWLGTVWVRDTIAIPLLIAVIAGMCVAHYDKSIKKEKPIPTPPSQVHINLLIDKPSGQESIKYVGDGETLIKVLEALKDTDQNKVSKHE